MLNILGCLDVPTEGSYSLDGEDVAQLDDDALSRVRNEKIGFVFQSFNLISHLNLVENVEVPLYYSGSSRKQRRECALAMIDRVGMSHRINHFPNELSGGECQRVAIARALSTDPRILLADEPTGNLDSTNGEQILALFRELHDAGKTIIMVTHDDEIAGQLDRRIRLHDGEIAENTGGAN